MRFSDIFEQFDNLAIPDIAATMRRADDTILAGRRQKKQASITKTKSDLAKKQQSLQKLNQQTNSK